jgi:hypothetical protein
MGTKKYFFGTKEKSLTVASKRGDWNKRNVV